jgi:GNAT superfamily N-acetyltransferase
MTTEAHILDRVHVRKASTRDVSTLLEIKASLAVSVASSPDSFGGGFLLGSSEELYLGLAHAGQIILVEDDDAQVLGFGIAIESEILRASELWARRDLIEWEPGFDVVTAMSSRVGYLDQLAIRPSAQRQWLGALLGCSIMEHFVATRHDLVLTTTLLEPMENTASLPLITRASGRRVGTLDEHYEGIGDVVSALHIIPPEGYVAMRDHTLDSGHAIERKVLKMAAEPHA